MSNTQPPMPVPVRSRWTSKDEAKLQELTERKQRIDAENRQPLLELVTTAPLESHADESNVTDWLIENATQLRALLLPFDHSTEL